MTVTNCHSGQKLSQWSQTVTNGMVTNCHRQDSHKLSQGSQTVTDGTSQTVTLVKKCCGLSQNNGHIFSWSNEYEVPQIVMEKRYHGVLAKKFTNRQTVSPWTSDIRSQ